MSFKPTGNTWQLQEAKAMLSEVIKRVRQAPQIITLRGEETAAIIPIETYREKFTARQNLYDFLQASPLNGLELELPERSLEEPRDVFVV